MADPSKEAIERADIGRVLIGLLQLPTTSEPLKVTDQYLAASGRGFRSAITRHNPIRIGRLWDLKIEKNDLVFVGGGGVVIQCRNSDVPNIKYALKFQRPSLLATEPGKAQEAYQEARQEYFKHAPLSHTNIAHVFGAGSVLDLPLETGVPHTAHPVLMEWIENARPLWRHLVERVNSSAEAIDVVQQCFRALSYLHASRLIHWDIKSDNFLISGSGVAKLTDIGNARRRDDTTRGMVAYSTRGNLPPAIDPGVGANGAKGNTLRTPVQLPDLTWDCEWLDLWMLAWDLNRLFAAVVGADRGLVEGETIEETRLRFLNRVFPRDDRDAAFSLACISLILKRLLKPGRPENARFYNSAEEVAQDLGKIIPEFGAAQAIPELHAIPQSVLRLPVSGNVPFPARVARLYNSSAVQSLTKHLQLATVSHVYPGATHRRAEHVAGVMATSLQYVRALYADRTNPFWRLQTERRDIDAILLAAMLHDVGHVAFGHFLEEMGPLLSGRTHEAFLVALLDPSRAGSAWPAWDTDSSLARSIATSRTDLLGVIQSDWALSSSSDDLCRYVAQIIRPEDQPSPVGTPDAVLDRTASDRLLLEIIHSIIDSAIDADKLDYLLRDAHHAGVQYTEGIDTQRFLQSLTTVTYIRPPKGREPSLRACVGVTTKGQLPVESILIGRYQMFSCVYWQHTTRAETAMLQYVVQEVIGVERNEHAAIVELERLLHVFRGASDREALTWIQNEIHLKARRLGAKKARILLDIMSGLQGNREFLYWRGFELRYEGRTSDRHSPARNVARYWLNVATGLGKQAGPLEFIGAMRKLRAGLVGELTRRLPTKLHLEPGELLIDIPPAGRDQIENVYVVMGTAVKAIQELTPLADAVHDAFALWVRAVRLFLAPAVWRRLADAEIAESQVWTACWDVMTYLSDRQLDLFSKAEG